MGCVVRHGLTDWPGARSLDAAVADMLRVHHEQSEACGSASWGSGKLMASERLDLEYPKDLRQGHRALVALI